MTLAYVHEGPATPAEDLAVKAKLQALVPQEGNVITQIAILSGSRPADALTHEANRLGADAICLGTHGRTGVQRIVYRLRTGCQWAMAVSDHAVCPGFPWPPRHPRPIRFFHERRAKTAPTLGEASVAGTSLVLPVTRSRRRGRLGFDSGEAFLST